MRLEANAIIKSPILSEKSLNLKEKEKLVCFKVHKDANKLQIKSAVEAIFQTKVIDVRVVNFQGKIKRYGRFQGRKNNWKKAYVKLAPEAKMIEFTEV
jgi:large subunit ribosomal protein L23